LTDGNNQVYNIINLKIINGRGNCKSSQNSVVSSQNKSGFELEFHSEF